jgi:hypothetical protein
MRQASEILEVDHQQLEEVLRRAEQALDEEDATLLRRLPGELQTIVAHCFHVSACRFH